MRTKSKTARFFTKILAFAMTALFVLTSGAMPVNAANDSGAVDYDANSGRYRNVMYYGDWSIWGGQGNFYPSGIPADQITHLNLAFLDFDANGNLVLTDTDAAGGHPLGMPGVTWGASNAGLLSGLQDLRAQNPNLRVGISVGGWSRSGDFTAVAANPAIRAKFIENLCKFVKYNNMDFVDLDWEFPGAVREPDLVDNSKDEGTPHSTPQDKVNFITLLRELKAALNQQGAELDKVYELSVAIPATPGQLDLGVNIAELFKIVDFANVMTYDLSGAWNEKAGHHTALYTNPADPYSSSGLSIDDAVTYLLSQGAVANKIVVGCAFYTRGWEKVANDGGVAGLPGLFGTASMVNRNANLTYSYGALNQAPLTNGDGGLCSGVWSYGALDQLKAKYPGLVEYWDDAAKASYLYNEATGAFFTYDSIRSIQAKTDYIKSEGLGGAISWQQANDKATSTGKRDELTRAIKEGLFGSADLTDYNISPAAIDVDANVTTYTDALGGGFEITLTNRASANESGVLGYVETMAETVKLPKLYIKTASGAAFTTGGYGSGNVTSSGGYVVVDMATVYDNQMIGQGVSKTFKLKSAGPIELSDIISIELSQRISSTGAEISRQVIFEGPEGPVVPDPVDQPPVLSGMSNETIEVGAAFDPMDGVSATDSEDGDLTAGIAVTGAVDVNVEGVYTLNYSVTDSSNQTVTGTRTITVAAVDNTNKVPVISGAGNQTLTVGDSFDPMSGVNASDVEDGDLTAAIAVAGSVDTSVAGSYTLTYTVADSQGAVTTVTRVITVEAAPAPGNYDSSKIYLAGDEVEYDGKTYRAKWWVQGGGTPDVNPAFELISGDDGGIPEYNPNTPYQGGARVMYEGRVYEAKWWTMGQAPGTNDVWLLIE